MNNVQKIKILNKAIPACESSQRIYNKRNMIKATKPKINLKQLRAG